MAYDSGTKSIARKGMGRATIAFMHIKYEMKWFAVFDRTLFVADNRLFQAKRKKQREHSIMGFDVHARKTAFSTSFKMLTYNFQRFVCLAIKHQKVCDGSLCEPIVFTVYTGWAFFIWACRRICSSIWANQCDLIVSWRWINTNFTDSFVLGCIWIGLLALNLMW